MTRKSTSLRIAINARSAYLQTASVLRSRYLFTRGGFVICSSCIDKNLRKFALDDLWEVANDVVNKKDRFLNCSDCGQRIPILN
jgi:hypothetical protein